MAKSKKQEAITPESVFMELFWAFYREAVRSNCGVNIPQEQVIELFKTYTATNDAALIAKKLEAIWDELNTTRLES